MKRIASPTLKNNHYRIPLKSCPPPENLMWFFKIKIQFANTFPTLYLLHKMMPPAHFWCQGKNRAYFVGDRATLLVSYIFIVWALKSVQTCNKLSSSSKLVICSSSISVTKRGVWLSFLCSTFVSKHNYITYHLNLRNHFVSFSSQFIRLDLGAQNRNMQKVTHLIGTLRFNFLHNIYQTIFLWKISHPHWLTKSGSPGSLASLYYSNLS